ncbi:MAG: trypsin-like peptidase domain-containing protein [Fibrobacteres bacterium]|nr:trypsin-like peptidase domain-containing protein [Fibrobacterota bacterium]
MRTRFILAALLMSTVAFAETATYDISSYARCLYNSKTDRYDLDCITKTDIPQLEISVDSLVIGVNGVKYSIDSSSKSVNSDNQAIHYVYTKDVKTKQVRCLVFNKHYVNVGSPGEWLLSYNVASNDTEYYQGSSFGINGKTLITNRHVIKDMKSIIVKIGDDYSRAVVQYSDLELDLALLKVDSIVNSCKLEDSSQEIGSEIVAYGFPKVNVQGQSIKATKGIISSKFGYQDDVKSYQIDAAIQNGNSGGPLAFKNKVVGVVVSRLAEGQNVNYAIKSVFVTAMLKSVGIKNAGTKNPLDCTYLIFGSNK